MTFKFRHFERIVGLFLFTGILILLVTVVFMGREQKWFQSKTPFKTVFDDGENLTGGMEVKMNGLVVGRVTAVSFASNNAIDVQFIVYEDFLDRVKSDSYVFKEASSPLGGGFLNLTIGTKNGRQVKAGEFLASQDSQLVQQLVATGYFPEKKGSIDKILRGVTQLVSQLASPYGPLIGTLANVKQLTGKLASSDGSLSAFMNDNQAAYKEILGSLASVRKIMEDMSVLSATLRSTSPNIRNLVVNAEKGLAETAKVMQGLQRYFSVSGAGSSQDKKDGPTSSLKVDRRDVNY